MEKNNMDISEIISDAITYPFNNIKALLLYVVLGIIAGLAIGTTLIGVITTSNLNNTFAAGGIGIIGTIISIIILLLISGYELDIIKYGINRDSGAPGIELGRQIVNAIKLIVLNIVYYIIPVIISFILGLFLRSWLTSIISIILIIIFALAKFMGECRLAKTDSLGNGLAVGEAIGDISKVGLLKLIATVIIVAIIIFILMLIILGVNSLNTTVGSILLGIFGIYCAFFTARVKGLLYSEV